MPHIYTADTLTGGTEGCVDYIDVANAPIDDGDICLCFAATYLYVYRANATSAAAESSPAVVAPDYSAGVAYTGDLRWLLHETYPVDAAIAAISALTPAANKLFYWTSATAASLIDITAGGRAVLAEALGAANLGLFVDAAGTGVEWARGIKIVNSTRDIATASGTQAITGAGFKPAGCIIFATVSGGVVSSYGVDDGTTRASFRLNPTNLWYTDTATSIYLITATGPENSATAVVSSLDADGVTLTWTKNATPTGTASLTFVFWR